VKVGDLVTVIQSLVESDKLVSPHAGRIGVIIDAQLGLFRDQDSFTVLLNNKMVSMGANYLEVISERQ